MCAHWYAARWVRRALVFRAGRSILSARCRCAIRSHFLRFGRPTKPCTPTHDSYLRLAGRSLASKLSFFFIARMSIGQHLTIYVFYFFSFGSNRGRKVESRLISNGAYHNFLPHFIPLDTLTSSRPSFAVEAFRIINELKTGRSLARVKLSL